MSKAPSMPMFVDAMLGDTLHLSTEQFGAYHFILYATWRNNGVALPDDNEMIARICRLTPTVWKKTRPILLPFFDLSDGTWRQRRLEKEWEYVAARAERSRENGANGGRPKKRKSKPTTEPAENPVGSPGDSLCGLLQVTQTESTHTHTHKEEPPAPIFQPVPAGEGKAGDFSNEAQEAVADFERMYGELFARDCMTPRLTLWAEAEKWLAEGFTVETLREAVFNGLQWFQEKGIKPPGTFDKIKSLHGIAEELRAQATKSGVMTSFAHPDASKWPLWAESFRKDGFWSDGRGVFPGTMPVEWVEYATGATDRRPGEKGRVGGSGTGVTLQTWRRRIRDWLDSDLWTDSWGPKPGEPLCEVPRVVLEELEQDIRRKIPAFTLARAGAAA